MITLFENFESSIITKLASLFYRKICEYGNVVGKTFETSFDTEIEFIEDNEKYIFAIIISGENTEMLDNSDDYTELSSYSRHHHYNDETFLTLKSSVLNKSLYYNSVLEYLKNSEFFKLISEEDNSFRSYSPYSHKFKILGTPEEIEEDLKNLEIIVQAKKYNL